jgi:hypothetical protein
LVIAYSKQGFSNITVGKEGMVKRGACFLMVAAALAGCSGPRAETTKEEALQIAAAYTKEHPSMVPAHAVPTVYDEGRYWLVAYGPLRGPEPPPAVGVDKLSRSIVSVWKRDNPPGDGAQRP